MIKLLDDLLIAAACNPNVPGAIVAGLREAVSLARRADGNPAGTPGAKVDLSRLDALPPPFDSMEEAQRAAGIVPTTAASYRVCVCDHGMSVVGDVIDATGRLFAHPEHWLQCDKDGWVSGSHSSPPGLKIEFREPYELQPLPCPWRPARGDHTASALDEMAEQVRRWASPTTQPDRLELWARTLENEHDTKPTNPKDAAATSRVPLGLLSPIAKAHWALAQHCGRAKYGAWNWRKAGARASIYLDAIGRHADGYLSGETHDPTDGTHHLGNIMACCAILLEAEAAGKLVDDRPPHLDMRPTYADVEIRMADLTAKYAARDPKHWTR